MTSLALVEVVDRAGLLAIGPEWDELRRGSTAVGPFTTWAWTGAWLETLGQDAEIVAAIARDPDTGRLDGLAAFQVCEVTRGGFRVRDLRMLGSGVAAPDHLDMLVRTGTRPNLATALWEAVTEARTWHRLNLDGVAGGGHLAKVTMRRHRDVAIGQPCPVLSLAQGWDSVSAGFSGRLRTNLARYERKLGRDADVAYRMTATHDDLDQTFDHLVRFHQSIRTGKGDSGVFSDPRTEQFLRYVAHRFLDAGRLRMWALEAAGTPIAIILCVRSEDSVSFYTTGYDPEWSRYGPGRQVMARAIRAAIDEGAVEFDFLRGDEPYKRDWGAVARDDLLIRRPSGPRGRLLRLAGTARSLSLRALRRDR